MIVLAVLSGGSLRAQTLSREQELERGREIYVRNCAICHGVVLEGMDAPASSQQKTVLAVPPLNEAGRAWLLPDSMLYNVVRLGEHALARKQSAWKMPSLRYSLKKDEIWTVLNYVKSTWTDEQRAGQAQTTLRDQKQSEFEKW